MSASKASAAVRQKLKDELPTIVERYLAGDASIFSRMAEENSIARRTFYRWILADLGGEKGQYNDLITSALTARIANADAMLEKATDTASVQKWAHIAKFARFDYERRRPALYGPKQLNVNVSAVSVDEKKVGRAADLLRLVVRPQERPTVTIEQDAPDGALGGSAKSK